MDNPLARVCRFYLENGPTSTGDTLQGIWRRGRFWYWRGYKSLEEKHDYIQWLFPTSQPSRFNQEAPLFSRKDIKQLSRENPEKMNALRIKILQSLDLMLGFYGLEDTKEGVIIRGKNFKERSAVWLTPDNHNFLRLTRILSCLRLFEILKMQAALFNILEDIKNNEGAKIISKRTFSYWKKAGSSYQENSVFDRLLSFINRIG